MKVVAKSGAAIAIAAALFAVHSAPPAAAADHSVKCFGLNACKGHGACKSTANACKGKNACKGQGFAMLGKAQCTAKGGSTTHG